MTRPSAEEPLTEYWADIRPKTLPRRKDVYPATQTLPIAPIVQWVSSFNGKHDRDTCRVVPGSLVNRLDFYASLATHQELYNSSIMNPAQHDTWCDRPLDGLTLQLSQVTISEDTKKSLLGHDIKFPEWELLWTLLLAEEFIVEGSLRDMVDQSHYLAHDIYRFIWAIRFLFKEGDYQHGVDLTGTLIRWMTGSPLSNADLDALNQQGIQRQVESNTERIDALCILVTMAEHNAVLHEVVLCLDGLESILTREQRPLLRQLHTCLTGLDRWVRNTACPIGVLIGIDASKKHQTNLKALNPKLYTELERCRAWIQ